MNPTYPLVIAMVVSLVLYQVNQRYSSPVIAIFNRWLRWFIFAFGAAVIAQDFGWSDRPYWLLTVTFFLVYFLAETVYRWLEIHALSVSPLPLFPRFSVNASGEEWPTHPRLLAVRDWIRREGLKPVQSLRAEVAPSLYLRVSVYQDLSAQLRLQVMFLPQANGGIVVCHSLASRTADGIRYVTDNLYLPFAGFYPENWLVERHPWRRSLKRLIALHRARLLKAHVTLLPWDTDPLADLNAQQHALEQVNTELGFLFPHPEREERGKMTVEGRYRVWKEIWLLNYFG
ncbi:MAG TPA: hypothetical protein VHF69_10480, partial [Candidatus Synoicihabitans sp.]|nr:hypothetical protein [Candidatus Synoicihabitans sp.]